MTKGGRPSKYNWESIKVAYESGFEKDEIVKKFKVSKAILTNKINKERWAIKCDVTADINELNATSHKITQNYTKDEKVAEMFIDRVNTIADDNELMQGTRKISKLLLSVIAQNKNEINLKNIKTVSSTLKDIENIANPRPDTVINNTNAMQSNYTIDDLYKEM